jgi:hypothetical protein
MSSFERGVEDVDALLRGRSGRSNAGTGPIMPDPPM